MNVVRITESLEANIDDAVIKAKKENADFIVSEKNKIFSIMPVDASKFY